MDNNFRQEENVDVGQDIVQLIEWLKKADLRMDKRKVSKTSIDDNNGGVIKL